MALKALPTLQRFKKARLFMHSRLWHLRPGRLPFVAIVCSFLLLAACGGGTSAPASGTSAPATKQVLTFPNVGISDIATLDPAQGPDANSNIVVNMIYSGLVRSDKNLNVVPDQATWQVSDNSKVYTFTLKPGITFLSLIHISEPTRLGMI